MIRYCVQPILTPKKQLNKKYPYLPTHTHTHTNTFFYSNQLSGTICLWCVQIMIKYCVQPILTPKKRLNNKYPYIPTHSDPGLLSPSCTTIISISIQPLARCCCLLLACLPALPTMPPHYMTLRARRILRPLLAACYCARFLLLPAAHARRCLPRCTASCCAVPMNGVLKKLK